MISNVSIYWKWHQNSESAAFFTLLKYTTYVNFVKNISEYMTSTLFFNISQIYTTYKCCWMLKNMIISERIWLLCFNHVFRQFKIRTPQTQTRILHDEWWNETIQVYSKNKNQNRTLFVEYKKVTFFVMLILKVK